MTKCLNCCGQTFDTMICPNCGEPAYKRGIDEISEVLGAVTVDKRGYEGFASVGPLRFQTQGLMSYAMSREWVDVAVNHPTLSVLFCRPGDAPDCDISLVLTDNPLRDFVRYHNYLTRETQFYGNPNVTGPIIAHRGAEVHKSVIGLCHSSIGERTVISPGVVLGMDGARFADGEKIEHAGGVSIGSDCFIGAGSILVRGVWGNDTIVGNRTFIGNLVNIGHNCVIGDDCMILPGSILCGSVTVGNGARISPNAVISDHVTIGDGAFVTLGAVVTRDVPAGERVSGNFAVRHNKWIDFMKALAKGE